MNERPVARTIVVLGLLVLFLTIAVIGFAIGWMAVDPACLATGCV